jgi:hypothetical protein
MRHDPTDRNTQLKATESSCSQLALPTEDPHKTNLKIARPRKSESEQQPDAYDNLWGTCLEHEAYE